MDKCQISIWAICVLATLLPIALTVLAAEDSRRPLWNIGHMANSIAEAKDFISRGANAIEFDVIFDQNIMPDKVRHVGAGCDCQRNCDKEEDFSDYLEFLRNICDSESKSYEKRLALIFFDLKTASFNPDEMVLAGKNVAKILAKDFWDYGRRKIDVKILICLYSFPSFVMAASFHETMIEMGLQKQLETTGFDTTGYVNVEELSNTWNKMKFTCRVWQGDGMSNCYTYACHRFQSIAKAKNGTELNYMSKIYYWTADSAYTAEHVLSLGADGTINNQPETLVSVTKKPGSPYRLATKVDSPWKQGDCLNDMVSSKEAKALTENTSSDYTFSMYWLIISGALDTNSKC